MTQTTTGLLFAGITSFCWSILAIVLKWALTCASSGTIVWNRMFVAFLLLFTFFALFKRDQLSQLKKPPLLAILAGILLGANYFGYMKGIEFTTASNAQVMIQFAPLTLSLIGIFYFKEVLSKIQIIGTLLALSGFGFFYWDQISLSVTEPAKYILGNSWILFAAISWAVFASFQKILTQKGWRPQQINLVIYFVASFALAPLANFKDFLDISLFEGLILFTLGVNTIVAYGFFGEALKRAPASLISLIICLNPLGTIFLLKTLEFLDLDFVQAEVINWRGYIGASLVVTGVMLTVALKKKQKVSGPISVNNESK